LTAAGTAYQVPVGGIPESALTAALQALVDGAEQTNNKNAAHGYAGLDAAQRVSAAHSALAPQVVSVSFASTITLNATTGNYFDVTVTGDFTLTKPTGGVNGQTIEVEFNTTGGHTVTMGAGINLGSATVVLSSSAKRDKLLLQYSS